MESMPLACRGRGRNKRHRLVSLKLIKMMGGELVMLLLILYIAFYCALAVL